jgi:hypothetical protein
MRSKAAAVAAHPLKVSIVLCTNLVLPETGSSRSSQTDAALLSLFHQLD